MRIKTFSSRKFFQTSTDLDLHLPYLIHNLSMTDSKIKGCVASEIIQKNWLTLEIFSIFSDHFKFPLRMGSFFCQVSSTVSPRLPHYLVDNSPF